MPEDKNKLKPTPAFKPPKKPMNEQDTKKRQSEFEPFDLSIGPSETYGAYGKRLQNFAENAKNNPHPIHIIGNIDDQNVAAKFLEMLAPLLKLGKVAGLELNSANAKSGENALKTLKKSDPNQDWLNPLKKISFADKNENPWTKDKNGIGKLAEMIKKVFNAFKLLKPDGSK